MYKVVLFNIDLSGGAGKFIITLANALAEEGVSVHIVILEEKTEYDLPPELSLHILNPRAPKRSLAKALKKYIDQIGSVDLIFSNSTPSNKILSFLDLPNAYHIVHSAETKNYTGPLGVLKDILRKNKYRRLYNGKKLITVSKGLQRYILDDLNAHPKTIQTIYNPFEINAIQNAALQNLEELPKEPYLLHVGRLDISSKRHDLLLEAYKKASVAFKLYIVGEGEDREEIQTLIHKMNLSGKVILQGHSPNPYAWMKRAKLLILSSDFEGFGRVLAEALIAGTPVVSTDCPSGPAEILTGSLQSYLSPPGDSNALAENILKALEYYPDISKLGLSHLSVENVAKEYMTLIDKISNKETFYE
ncbi:glycosyltransferase [Nitratifractor salsuginis]|uniref:Glycosyl transferase group 1 n=1 Tax=Nitratifractor salsuginis (strain DSM 16511 / JCM 12458 / E9I37-1) TaxID=749222 RepID=E6WZD6_NITSE|nr:glycosyltransferase [Nitratifractor salsuginis]ADV46648.1 glycosyl transferase group 1 [Nitratifractor salsuginis DSM 16511]